MNERTNPNQPTETADLVIDPPVSVPEGQVEFRARIVSSAGHSRALWFRFPEHQGDLLTRRADPFVIAVLVHAMRQFRRLSIHGTVSPGLLANLTDFQAAFRVFHEGRPLPPMELQATATASVARPSQVERGISAFSGGVDSCFTVFRHTSLSPLQPKRALGGSLMMHGFDISLDDPAVFARSAARSKKLTDDAGLTLHTGATNIREFPEKWEDVYATSVAAALSFFQPAYAFGLLPSFQDWAHTHFNYGSSPLTDPMLSSLTFPLVHDGAAFGRLEKLRQLQHWPALLRHLRVCWQGSQMDRNCCRCEKCVRTMLMLEVIGVPQAEAFPHPVDLDALDHLVIKGPNALEEQMYLLAEAQRLGLRRPWMAPIARSIRRNARHQRLWRTGRALKEFLPDAMHDGLRHAASRWLWRGAPPVNGAVNGAVVEKS